MVRAALISLGVASLLVGAVPVLAQDLKTFNGQWNVVKLVENGQVIPPAAIPEWIPSGGKLDIQDGAILFTSHVDNKKHARLFTIDATRDPDAITITNADKTQSSGIFKFDGNDLVVCLSHSGETNPPSDFSAEAGSQRMLMVLRRAPAVTIAAVANAPKVAQAPIVDDKVLTDADIARMLVGTWQYDDHGGSLIVQYRADGTYGSTRAIEKMKMFKTLFIESPTSAGIWRVDHSRLLITVQASQHPERLGLTYGVTIRSISPTDLIFVDDFGRVGKGTRLTGP